jgi:16S rRNA (guanine1516-N2)-methyltransferase
LSQNQQLDQHLLNLDFRLVADQIQAQLPEHITLSLQDGVLCLYEQENPQSILKVDFIHGSLSYRSQQHLGAENLIKACKIKGQEHVKLLDGTCGLGTDSFLLYQAGFQVTAVEKSIITYALLKDGIDRYEQHMEEQCFQLVFDDVENQLIETDHDVIYLDPMFPAKVKSAKNKKAMQLFQRIHQNQEDDAAELLNMALNSSCKRVVIKRPSKAPVLTKSKPTFQVIGKTCRFDAYQLI